jgi:hypothetical protein
MSWEQDYAIPYAFPHDLVVDRKGNCLAAINYSFEGGPVSFGANTFITIGENELAILKFAPSGDLRWVISSVAMDSPANNPISNRASEMHNVRLALAPNGICYASANFQGTYQFGQAQLRGPNYNGGNAALLVSIVDPETVQPQQPVVQITRSGNGVLVNWPLSAVGFTLETARSLNAPFSWVSVGAPPDTSAGLNSVHLDAPASPAFYRLRSP